jgi:Domain of unknown function (DUF4169)
MPADIVNLNKARKSKAKLEGQRQAEENRAKFGRTKIEKLKDKDERYRRDATLDGAKRVTRESGVLSNSEAGRAGAKDGETKP